jgi:hypothetical protein
VLDETCGPDTCIANEVLLINGKCEVCKEGSVPIDGKCIDIPKCNTREKLDFISNMCIPCPVYERAQSGNTYCGPDQCDTSKRERLNLDGSCFGCPDYSKLSSDGKNCITNPCNILNQVVERDGECRTCL